MSGETKQSRTHFVDLLFNKHVVKDTIATGPYSVMLSRDGQNGIGEEMGRVEVYAYGQPTFGCAAQLDKAQGYAQGILDGFQIALGLAGRAPEGG